MKPKKLECLEGIRAIASISVVLCHLWGAFFPASRVIMMLTATPLFFLFSGNTAVRLLFTLSGFVLSYKYFAAGKTDTLERDVVKRYFRLALPVMAAIFMVYGMMKLNLMYNSKVAPLTGSQDFLGTFNQFEPNLKSCFWEGLWGTLFRGWSTYIGATWTMTYEMLGSYLSFAVIAVLKNKRARYLFYILYLLIFSSYFCYFILGMAICDIYIHEEAVNLLFKKSQALSVVLHLLCWSYIGMVSNIDLFRWKALLFLLAVTVLFLTLLNNSLLDRVWSNKPAVLLGKHSFSIYLLHWPIIESASCAYLYYLTELGYSLKLVVITDLFFTIGVLFAISALFTRFVVQPSVRISDWAAERILGS